MKNTQIIIMAAVLAFSFHAVCAQEKEFAVTSFSVNYMREDPDFTAELGNQLLMGTPVEIMGEEGYWKKIKSPEPYTAWCVDLGLVEMTKEDLSRYIAAEKIICTADYGRVLPAPSGKSGKICDIVMGDLLVKEGKCVRGYYRVRLPSGEAGYVRKKDAEVFSDWAARRNPDAGNIISTACGFKGVPYFWGGTSIKGVDCSGFTRMVWFMNGILLPRNASAQAAVGKPVGIDADTSTFPVDSCRNFADSPLFRQEMVRRISGLEKGDLIFFGTPGTEGQRDRISHVGIYIGNGKFIHASKVVRINSLIPGDKDWYELSGRMILARRITGCGQEEGIVKITDSPAYFPQQ